MKPAILFLTETFLQHGGVETRIRLYAQAYWARGWNVYIEPTQYRNSTPDNFKLGKNGFINTCWLVWWKFTRHIRIIEWQSGSSENIKFYPFIMRLLGVHLGIVFHGVVGKEIESKITNFHYALCVSEVQKKRYPALAGCTVIPNALPRLKDSFNIWKWQKQTRALYISRLDKDKMPSILAFIRFCNTHHIPMDIAGTGYILQNLKEQYGGKNIHFIGPIDTKTFLQNQQHKYLFVGGIGQVALEGITQGYPVLITPLTGEEYCFFATNENLEKLQFYNFSPHTPQEAVCFEKDIQATRYKLQQLQRGEYKTSWLSIEQVFAKYDFNQIFERYWNQVFKK